MAQGSIVGRDREVARLTEAVDDAAAGHGSVWYLTGEPGIGKSRLAEEVSRLARERGMRAFWGRCWEAGGAPAYWPWVQVLRGVLRTAEPGRSDAHAATLAQILPELRSAEALPEVTELRPEQARFQLMDAVSNVLADSATWLPLLIVLEDLHVADVSTVLLLEFLTAAARNHALLIVGTFRELDLASAPAGAQLMRAAQQGQRLPLARLTRDDVESFLRASGEDPDPAFVTALHETTEGHPLFLVEVARLWQARGPRTAGAPPPIPRSVRTAIQERLTTVSAGCLDTLRRGAVVGREFDLGLLEACDEGPDADHVSAAQEATDAAILVEVAPQRYRFVHFLIRELVYQGIAEEARKDAHARLAATLAARARDGEPRWSEIAHHLVAASRCEDAARAYRNAGAQALRQLAFDEAVQAHGDALRAAARVDDFETGERIELLLDLGHAQTRAGDIVGGKKTCIRAARLARDEDDAALLAKAALEHGTALQYGRVDTELVALLEEALEALGPGDSSLRARVMARLAAALQPAEDPEGPMQLAREAIEMARRLDSPETLMDTLRNGGSAMVDLGDVDERVVLDRELAVLAEELGNPVEALRGNLRSIMDFLALERLDDAYRAMRACERITEELQHPAYAWRPVAMRAMRALWEGRLDEAERLIEEAKAIGERGSDVNAGAVCIMQKLRLLQYRGDFDAQLPLLSLLEGHWAETEIGRAMANVTAGAEHVNAGRLEAALRCFDHDAIHRLLRLGDHTLQLSIAKLCVAAEDRELAERLHRRMPAMDEHLVTGGILYMTLEGPTSWGLAWIADFLGHVDEADQHYAHALEVARRAQGHPVEALIAFEHATRLALREEPDAQTRAVELARRARSIANDIGMPALKSKALQLCEELETDAPDQTSLAAEPATPTMTQTGDSWLVHYENVEFHLKNVRGVRMLAALLAEPGREFHVLDLTQGSKAQAVAVDRGDSGEALDEEAKRQYRARVLELREEVEEAERWNDSARADKAGQEMEFIAQELSRAVGLGGRERRSGSASERARINVQRRIRDAIRRIESYHPGLAKHLDRSIRTGAYCAYEP